MRPRQLVTDLLADNLPDTLAVLPYARDGIVPARTTVMLRVDDVIRAPAAPINHRAYTYAILVVAALIAFTLGLISCAPPANSAESTPGVTYSARSPSSSTAAPTT